MTFIFCITPLRSVQIQKKTFDVLHTVPFIYRKSLILIRFLCQSGVVVRIFCNIALNLIF